MMLTTSSFDLAKMTYLEIVLLDELSHQLASAAVDRSDALDEMRRRVPWPMIDHFDRVSNEVEERADTIDMLMLDMCFLIGSARLREVEAQFTRAEIAMLNQAFESMPAEEAGPCIARLAQLPVERSAQLLRFVLGEVAP